MFVVQFGMYVIRSKCVCCWIADRCPECRQCVMRSFTCALCSLTPSVSAFIVHINNEKFYGRAFHGYWIIAIAVSECLCRNQRRRRTSTDIVDGWQTRRRERKEKTRKLLLLSHVCISASRTDVWRKFHRYHTMCSTIVRQQQSSHCAACSMSRSIRSIVHTYYDYYYYCYFRYTTEI